MPAQRGEECRQGDTGERRGQRRWGVSLLYCIGGVKNAVDGVEGVVFILGGLYIALSKIYIALWIMLDKVKSTVDAV